MFPQSASTVERTDNPLLTFCIASILTKWQSQASENSLNTNTEFVQCLQISEILRLIKTSNREIYTLSLSPFICTEQNLRFHRDLEKLTHYLKIIVVSVSNALI